MNELRNCRIWAKTQRKLNRLAQLKGVKQIGMLDELVDKALRELQQSNPEYSQEIDKLISDSQLSASPN